MMNKSATQGVLSVVPFASAVFDFCVRILQARHWIAPQVVARQTNSLSGHHDSHWKVISPMQNCLEVRTPRKIPVRKDLIKTK